MGKNIDAKAKVSLKKFTLYYTKDSFLEKLTV